jgi:hypothetical protein
MLDLKKTYSTRRAAGQMGVSFRTLNRWLALEKVRPSKEIALEKGQTLWRWTDADIARGKKVKAAQKPGPKAKPKPKRRREG